ncbi:tetratricopeptide repeat protein [Amycolatopsis suaedae]|uniref:Tetratricopeptide repeat protein n=1 Tax=Amycolatopsis suaedae TaxID=2510978 RepID=A0A4Q7JDX6_9PSEU|nr:tetratricopeptide repeat protein [Amycolatopsis suaedae]RZQ65669.1 tetratricopeptide repeat protein [Amycolatopsis suaedae]
MGERRALVIASQCATRNLLSFLPETARELAGVLLDPDIGGCVPALPDGRDLVVDPTAVELDDAVTTAFERADEDEATLFLALVGHGDYRDDDFYFLPRDATEPVSSRTGFLLAQRVKELLGRYSMLDGLVVLLDTCHAAVGAEQAAARWIRIVGEAGRRFEVLTASDHRPAADGCFSRSLARTLRAGQAELGQRLRAPDLKRVVAQACPDQTALHLAFDGVRQVADGDEGLWLAYNTADVVRRSPLWGSPVAVPVEKAARAYEPGPELGEVLSALYGPACLIAVTGDRARELLAALAWPQAAPQHVPPQLLQAALFLAGSDTVDAAVRELRRQLRHTVPGFAGSTVDSTAEPFDREIAGPLSRLPSQPVRIAVGGADTLAARTRSWLLAELERLAGENPGVRVVVTTDDPPPGWTVVRTPTVWMAGAGLGRPAPPGPRPYPPLPREGLPVVPRVLEAVPPGVFLPLRVLTAASARLGGPSGRSRIHDQLAHGNAIRREPGTPAESARARHPRGAGAEVHAAIADALREVAPVAERDGHGPEQDYADAHEAEHLWRAGRHAEAVTSLETRPSDIPVENRERWTAWARRAEYELGREHPLTRVCRARHATATGKAGDAEHARRLFAELLAAPVSAPEEASLRNNAAFQLLMLDRHQQARAEFTDLVEFATARLGPGHEETLLARHMLAIAIGGCGDVDDAVARFTALRPEVCERLGADHDLVGKIDENLVFWGRQMAHPPPGLDELATRLPIRTGSLNDQLHARFTLALDLARAGGTGEAVAAWEELLPEALRVLGERHPTTRKIREQLEHWRD